MNNMGCLVDSYTVSSLSTLYSQEIITSEMQSVDDINGRLLKAGKQGLIRNKWLTQQYFKTNVTINSGSSRKDDSKEAT